MARESGFNKNELAYLGDNFQRLVDLVRADEREETNRRANASWTLMCEKMVSAEREACAKLVDDIEARCIAKDVDDPPLKNVAATIRARGETK
jgi:hypothetical protein